MVEDPLRVLSLGRDATGANWEARFDLVAWRVDPNWPSQTLLSELRWLAEEPEQAEPSPAESEAIRARAQAAGQSLWESLIGPAPTAVAATLRAEPPAIALDLADEVHLLALSLLYQDDHGWLVLKVPSLSAKGAQTTGSMVAGFRLLLVTARPFGETDAPYLALSHPILARAAELGIRAERQAPARKRDIARRLQQAAEAGDPFTILVFDGHGAGEGLAPDAVALEGRFQADVAPSVCAAEFADLLGDAPPPLILLLACRTALSVEKVENPITFAGALARASEADVVGMGHNIAPRDGADLAVAILDGLASGMDVAASIQHARGALSARGACGLAWMAPLHFQQRSLRFERTSAPTGATPPAGYLRDLECLTLERGFETRPMRVLLGPPLSGKTHFLAFYRWFWSTRGLPAPYLSCDASDFDGPLAWLEHLLDREPRDGALVTLDNLERWGATSPAQWEPLAAYVRLRAPAGVRWLLAARSPPSLPESLRDVVSVLPLFGLAGAGARGERELREVEAYFWDGVSHQPGWRQLLLVCLRGEPGLLLRAARALRAGIEPRALLWSFIFGDPAFFADTAVAPGRDDDLAWIDPAIGWAFGLDGRQLLAARAAPDMATREVAARRFGATFAAIGEAGLAINPTGSWIMSAEQAARLRGRLPVDQWTTAECAGFVQGMTFLRNTKAELDQRRTLIRSMLSGAPTAPRPSANRMAWADLLFHLPHAVAAARIAADQTMPVALAEIAGGMVRVLMEFDLIDACESWLSYWRERIEAMPDGAPGRADGMALLNGEVERLSGYVGVTSTVAIGEERLAETLRGLTGGRADGDLARDIAAVVDALADDQAGAHLDLIDELINSLMMLSGEGAIRLPLPVLETILPRLGSRMRPEQAMQIELVLALAYLQNGRAEEAVACIARALALRDPTSDFQVFISAMAAVEVYALSGHPDVMKLAQQGLAAAKNLGDELSIGLARLRLCTAYSVVGDLERARVECNEAIPRLRQMNLYHLLAQLHYAKLSSGLQDLVVAETYRARVEHASAGQPDSNIHRDALVLGAVIALQAGDAAQAEDAAERLLKAAARGGFDQGEGVALWVQAEFAAARGEARVAYEKADRAVALLIGDREGYRLQAAVLAASAAHISALAQAALEAQERVVAIAAAMKVDPAIQAQLELLRQYYALVAKDLAMASAAGEVLRSLPTPAAENRRDLYGAVAVMWRDAGRPDEAFQCARLALEAPGRIDPALQREAAAIVRARGRQGLIRTIARRLGARSRGT